MRIVKLITAFVISVAVAFAIAGTANAFAIAGTANAGSSGGGMTHDSYPGMTHD